jgi:5-formyltetrahydrofolate cyclo-ligase
MRMRARHFSPEIGLKACNWQCASAGQVPPAQIFMKEKAMPELSEQKATARKLAFVARKQAFELGLDAEACGHLSAIIAQYPNVEVISGYMPIRTEISPLPVMRALSATGRRVCVPVIQRLGLPLLFREWTPDCRMVGGPFGALVPESGAYLEPEILIAPLLAFDARGYRLGYGGGFYDRSLEGLRSKRKTLAFGFAYSAQQVGQVPIEATDQPLDAIVTEAGLIRPF